MKLIDNFFYKKYKKIKSQYKQLAKKHKQLLDSEMQALLTDKGYFMYKYRKPNPELVCYLIYESLKIDDRMLDEVKSEIYKRNSNK